MMTVLIEAMQALSGWEVLATLLGILYLVLIIRESFWAWPSAFLSTLIYTVLFWEGQLPLQAVLNAYYLIMAVYGFWVWKHADKNQTNQAEPNKVVIHTKSPSFHLLFIFSGALVTLLLGYYLTQAEASISPYLDAGVMVFSVMNTWLVARKVFENWDYWIVINAAAFWLYWQSEFYVTMLLMAIYFVMALVGRMKWKQRFQQQALATASSA